MPHQKQKHYPVTQITDSQLTKLEKMIMIKRMSMKQAAELLGLTIEDIRPHVRIMRGEQADERSRPEQKVTPGEVYCLGHACQEKRKKFYSPDKLRVRFCPSCSALNKGKSNDTGYRTLLSGNTKY